MQRTTATQDIEAAISLIERANSRLRPEELTRPEANSLMRAYGRIQKLGGFGLAALSPAVADPSSVARISGTSLGKAREVVAAGTTLGTTPELDNALRKGEVSLDQAVEIARAEDAAPGAARELIEVARKQDFHVLKDKARKIKLEAEQGPDLAARQRDARKARTYGDPLGMVHIHLELQPHIGAPIMARAEAEAQRLARAAKTAAKSAATGCRTNPRRTSDDENAREPFERYLADAYAGMLSGGSARGPAKRPELTVLVSHSVAKRGWKDVKPGEICKIPGIGPVSPVVAREIASDAFLNGVFFDGKDLRNFKRWSRDIPVEIRAALELGKPPDFDGIRCVDCGNHYKTELDHVHPHVAGGPLSTANLEPRCWPCHQAKTTRDRRAGKLRPPPLAAASGRP